MTSAEYKREWKKNNPDKVRAERKRYKEKNRDRINSKRREVRQAKSPKPPKIELTPDQIKAKRYEAKKAYRKKYPDKVAAEKRRNYQRVKNDPTFKIAKNLRKRLKKFLKQGEKIGKAKDMFGCTPAELKLHLEQLFESGMTWDNYGQWHIDHIRPMASFDLSDKNVLCQINYYTNLRPEWANANQDKGSFWDGSYWVKGKRVTEES